MRFCATVQAGATLKLISGSVPLVGGLAGFAGAALKAGDSAVQTRRLEKVTLLLILAVVFYSTRTGMAIPP